MTTKRRAHLEEDKQARRLSILQAAGDLFEETGGALATAQAVAERVGLAKGTLYLYFRTKEEIFLSLLGLRFSDWVAAIIAALEGRAASIEDVVEAIAGPILGDPRVLRLATYAASVLEHNVEEGVVLRYKQALAERLADAGATVERVLPGVPAGQGARLLLRSYALILGLWQQAEPAPLVREILARPELLPLRVDFAAELTEALSALWRGSLPAAA